ncbi:MAG: hypothetical protein WBO04_12025 [Steroidobacteraceae bacterium]
MAAKRKTPGKRSSAEGAADETELTAAERRALDREIEDLDDPVRYLLASGLVPGFTLYYVLADDTWILNDPRGATLFKRREAARSIRDLLRPGVAVVPCKVDRRGQVVLKSLAGRKVGRTPLVLRPTWRE